MTNPVDDPVDGEQSRRAGTVGDGWDRGHRVYEVKIEQTTFSFDANFVLVVKIPDDSSLPIVQRWWAIGKTEREAHLFRLDEEDHVFPLEFGLVDGRRWTTEGIVVSQQHAGPTVFSFRGDAPIYGLLLDDVLTL